MRTIKYFDDKIVELATKLTTDITKMKKAEAKYTYEQIAAYKLCKTYLQSNPDEAFVQSQLDGLVKFVDEKMKEFDDSKDWSQVPKPVESEQRKAWVKKWDIEHKKYQIRWLRFLLEK